jgi:4-hydroxy-tetrahydrodipicolinate reductase
MMRTMRTLRIAVFGANGRMGRSVVRLAHAGGLDVVCAVGAADVGRDAGELAGIAPLGVPVVEDVAAVARAKADVVIDFSVPTATAALLPVAAGAGVAVVSGTTGLGETERAALAVASERVPVLWEPNMSVGIHVLAQLVRQAVSALDGWDIEVIEAHHGAKVDSPSGTAIRLADVAREARGSGRFVHGRQGRPGPRATDEIGVHALRGGDVFGDHTVHLMSGGERIELTHRATGRDVFAYGALRAAAWIATVKAPGRYALADMLSGSSPGAPKKA